jgi:hypothetical protein
MVQVLAFLSLWALGLVTLWVFQQEWAFQWLPAMALPLGFLMVWLLEKESRE